jgi:Protein of unknown function (DUF3572)
MKAPLRQTRKAAEMLAIQALGFIAEDDERLERFLTATGIVRDGIRAASREPGFLAGVLEHMLANETLLLAFADSAAINPAELSRAARVLGGFWERDLP